MLILFNVTSAKSPPPAANGTARPQIISIKGVVQSINRDKRQLAIRHEAISNCLAAMTMPFQVRTIGAPAGFHNGDENSSQLLVAETRSWVDQIVKPEPPHRQRRRRR